MSFLPDGGRPPRFFEREFEGVRLGEIAGAVVMVVCFVAILIAIVS